MIDFYRKSFLAQLGKDAGNQTLPDFTRNVIDNYDRYLAQTKEQKAKPIIKKEDYGLYL